MRLSGNSVYGIHSISYRTRSTSLGSLSHTVVLQSLLDVDHSRFLYGIGILYLGKPLSYHTNKPDAETGTIMPRWHCLRLNLSTQTFFKSDFCFCLPDFFSLLKFFCFGSMDFFSNKSQKQLFSREIRQTFISVLSV